MDRLQASLSWARWIASCTVRPMSAQSLLTTSSHLFLVALAGHVHTLPVPALDSDLVPFCSRGQSIEVVVAESDCGHLGSASICRTQLPVRRRTPICSIFWSLLSCGLFNLAEIWCVGAPWINGGRAMVEIWCPWEPLYLCWESLAAYLLTHKRMTQFPRHMTPLPEMHCNLRPPDAAAVVPL